MQTLRRTATVLIWPALASLGAACDQLGAPTAVVEYGIIPGGGGPGKVTGGGQIFVEGGTATFGFNVKREEGTNGAVKGHLNYVNHVTGVHLNCEVELAGVTPATETAPGFADFGGYECNPNSSFSSFTARAVDRGEPGRSEEPDKSDEFTITYNGMTEGGPIRSGNIQVHK